MTITKVQKYLNKISAEHIDSTKFGLYLDKLNYWYNQMGGKHRLKVKKQRHATATCENLEPVIRCDDITAENDCFEYYDTTLMRQCVDNDDPAFPQHCKSSTARKCKIDQTCIDQTKNVQTCDNLNMLECKVSYVNEGNNKIPCVATNLKCDKSTIKCPISNTM